MRASVTDVRISPKLRSDHLFKKSLFRVKSVSVSFSSVEKGNSMNGFRPQPSMHLIIGRGPLLRLS